MSTGPGPWTKRLAFGSLALAIILSALVMSRDGLVGAGSEYGVDANASGSHAGTDSPASSAIDSNPRTGGIDETTSSSIIGKTAKEGGAPPPFFPIRNDPGARDALRAADPLERILTPTSEADQSWMQSYAYPRLQDFQGRSIADAERAFAEAGNDGRPLGQSSRDRVANTVAAAKWQAGDPEWREWAQRSQSPFARALELADAMKRFRTNPRDRDARLALNRAVSAAYARGERALALEYLGEAERYPGYYAGPERPSPLLLFEGFHEIDIFNERLRLAGSPRPPMVFVPRPAPDWTYYGQRMN